MELGYKFFPGPHFSSPHKIYIPSTSDLPGLVHCSTVDPQTGRSRQHEGPITILSGVTFQKRGALWSLASFLFFFYDKLTE